MLQKNNLKDILCNFAYFFISEIKNEKNSVFIKLLDSPRESIN